MIRLTRLSWIVLLLAITAPGASAARGRPATAPSATVLIGQSWLGLWRGGRVVTSRMLDGWQFGAARLSRDGRTVEVAAYRTDAAERGDTILRFDARTLAPRGRGVDPAMTTAEVRAPIGVYTNVPDDSAALARAKPGSRPRTAAGDRVVMSPDGGVVAVFVRPTQAGAAWPGTATRLGAPRALASPGLFIDDGSRRENGSARALACLLPRGEGAIFTYLGQPADGVSEFQAFAPGARPVELKGPYVMSCLVPSGSRPAP